MKQRKEVNGMLDIIKDLVELASEIIKLFRLLATRPNNRRR
jgi:hypothetical protein